MSGHSYRISDKASAPKPGKIKKVKSKKLVKTLNKGIYGISFSAYLEGQGPGTQITREQVEERMKILQPHAQWIRSFSCIDGNEYIPEIAHKYGLKTVVGIWIGDDKEKNALEMEAAIELAKKGHADVIAVGNEVLLRGDLSEDELIKYMQEIKYHVNDIPVGYVDAYYVFVNHPRICDLSDVLLINCYPFWEGYSIDEAGHYMKEMYKSVKEVANNKKVIISETGWPNLGAPERGAVPSYENAIRYFLETYEWAEEEDIDIIYFSSFDETWKVGAEGDVGAFWGLWDKDGNLKYG